MFINILFLLKFKGDFEKKSKEVVCILYCDYEQNFFKFLSDLWVFNLF